MPKIYATILAGTEYKKVLPGSLDSLFLYILLPSVVIKKY